MKFWTWKYKNESNPDLPSRKIKWEFRIPYLLRLECKLFWKGHSFSISIPLLSIYYMVGTPCGKFFSLHREKVYLNPIWYGPKGVVSIGLGISSISYLDWKVVRVIKKMSPKERIEIRNKLAELANAD